MIVVTATAIEAAAARREMPGVEVIEAGIALLKRPELRSGAQDIAISCGIAGGLDPALPTGTAVIPRSVLRPDGSSMECDPELTDALLQAAHALGIPVCESPLLTAATLVVGVRRALWAQRGYAAVDMETALLGARRVAAVRVILDTPQNELSPAWSDPARALLDPRNWPQAFWLARKAPACSRIAARIIARAITQA